ncbi:MAG: hypothetical protein OHK0053_31180 [Microscillaceae bacterium]
MLWINQAAFAQLVIDQNTSAAQILEQLLGSGVSITNIQINCPSDRDNGLSFGRFVNSDINLPLDSGIVLSTGRVATIPGTQSNFIIVSHEWTGTQGDADLQALAGIAIEDACVISFNISPVGNQLLFNYTFASEEYPDFTPCNQQNFNDAFAFFISGPQPGGGNYNKRNIALIPGTNQPVSINTVNQCTNTQYYQSNVGGQTLSYNAFTRNLVAQVEVVPCQTYTLFLKIGDGGDGSFDSAVFIEQINSFVPTFTAPELTLVEDCNQADIQLSRPQSNRAESFLLDIEGDLIINEDFTMSIDGQIINALPFTVNFAVGQTLKNIVITPLEDNQSEGSQAFTLQLLAICGGQAVDSLAYEILDKDDIVPVPAYPGNQVYRCEPGQVIELEARPADDYQWTGLNGANFTCLDPDCRNIRVNTLTESQYKVDITIGICTFSQTLTVSPSYLSNSGNVSICVGESIEISASGRETYSWSPAAGLSCTDCPNPVASPTTTTTYTVQGEQGDCRSSTSLTVEVIQEVGPQITGLNDGYCVDAPPVNLNASPTGGTFRIEGNGISLENATTFNPAAFLPGNYQVTYRLSTGGGCAESTTQTVQVYALPNVPVFSGLAAEYCINAPPFNLTATPSSAASFFSINGQTRSLFDPASLGLGVQEVSYTYIDANGCQRVATQLVLIKDIPQLSFVGLANQYCVSENLIEAFVQVQEPGQAPFVIKIDEFSPAQLGAGASYTVAYNHQAANGCTNQIEQNISILPLPVLAFVGLDPQYCEAALPVTLQATPAGGVFRINGQVSTVFDPTFFLPGQTPEITYTFADAQGCVNQISQTILITSSGVQASEPEVYNLQICPDEYFGYALVPLEDNEIVAGYTFAWSPGEETSNRLIIRNQAQSGVYQVVVRDAENCPVLYATYNVDVRCEPSLMVPTAFSPNQDGLNDVLQLFGKDLGRLDFRIFNRWGEVIFVSNQQEQVWDGTFQGADVPPGTYLWTAKYVNILAPETVIEKSGRINLVR